MVSKVMSGALICIGMSCTVIIMHICRQMYEGKKEIEVLPGGFKGPEKTVLGYALFILACRVVASIVMLYLLFKGGDGANRVAAMKTSPFMPGNFG